MKYAHAIKVLKIEIERLEEKKDQTSYESEIAHEESRIEKIEEAISILERIMDDDQ